MQHAVDNHNGICHTEDSVPTRCNRTIKNGACSDFDLLDAALVRVLILLASLGLIDYYSIVAEKLVKNTHKLFLCIIRPYIDQNATLVETILKNHGNVEAGIGSYCIDVVE